MKHIIILGDGMADHAVARLGGKTLLQYADTPYMNRLAREGRTGRLMTIPDGFCQALRSPTLQFSVMTSTKSMKAEDRLRPLASATTCSPKTSHCDAIS